MDSYPPRLEKKIKKDLLKIPEECGRRLLGDGQGIDEVGTAIFGDAAALAVAVSRNF